MTSTLTAATLTVTLTEAISLNGYDQGASNSITIASIASGEISLRTINPGEGDTGDMTPSTSSADGAIRSKSWVR